MKKIKDKYGYVMAFSALCLMVIQRFLPCLKYGPVMDDWFNYGDLYEKTWSQYVIPTQKLAIRPMAGLFDIFVTAPAFGHLWIIKLLMCLMLFAAVFMLYKVFEKNGFSAGGALFLIVCLLPLNTEATYWIAAASRIVCALFFISLSLVLIIRHAETSRSVYLIFYAVTGLCAVGFCEQAILPYLFLNAYVILKNCDKRLFIIPIMHVIIIALFYLVHRNSPEITARGQFLTEGILSHTKSTAMAALQIIVPINIKMLVTGFSEGAAFLLSEHKFFLAVITVVSAVFGYFASLIQNKAEKFNTKRAVISVGVAVSGILLFFILNDARFTIRSTFFFIVGVGVFMGELLSLIPRRIRLCIYMLGFSCTAFIFTVSGINIINQFDTASAHDVEIADNLVKADIGRDLTNPDKCSYLLDTFTYYRDIHSVECWETIRAACSGYADITGCVRHRLNTAETNNLITIQDGESVDLATNLWAKSCRFFALMPDLRVIRINISPDGDNFNLFTENGDLYGRIVFDTGTNYRFEKFVP